MCYTVPLATSIITTTVYRIKKSKSLWYLNLLLYGGAIFGVIDHLWNGELFLVSENWKNDILLGVVITLSTFIFWGIILLFTKPVITLSSQTR